MAESTVRAHETGQNNIRPKAAEAYASILGVTPVWILYGDNVAISPLVPNRADIKYIPVRGTIKNGYFIEERFRKPTPSEELALLFPNFQRVALTAFLEEPESEDEHFRNYVIVAPDDAVGVYAGDDIVARRKDGDKVEIGLWTIGAQADWVIFYRGRDQASAHEVLKFRSTAKHHGFEMIGVVVGRYSLIRRRPLWGRLA